MIDKGNEVNIYSIYPSKDQIIHEQVKTHHLIEKTQYFFYPKGYTITKLWLTLKFVFANLSKANPKRTVKGLKSIFSRKIEPLFGFNFIFLNGIQDLDILHAHFGEIGVLASKVKMAGLIPNTKVVVSFHGHDIFPFRKDFYRKEYAILKKFSSALIVNSFYSLSLVEDIIPCSHAKVLPVGLSLSYFKPQHNSLSRSKIRIVFLGRLVYLKGGLLMFEIFRQLLPSNPGLELVIIGDGEQRGEIEEKIKEFGLSNSIKLKGTLSQDRVIEEFNESSIYVYPGMQDPIFKAGDTQGLVIQEAQAMELPVVCSDVGGIKYGMVDGETGFLVKEGDIDGFVEKIQLLIDQPDLRDKMGKAGRAFVKKHFDSKLIGDQLQSVYTEVLNEG
ncbi:glycosyltransferase family 4 protein [Algoriphagus formosus]|uniref:glycosyltransferase family 4 protein n=1 Tax=Algoriphagus formosus TaxID=2007308 RepID=UPI0012FE0464|nr:glycosyltransferase family 4 protein [Algoriphagus formosus]